jgi:hypothetical protein
MGRRRINSDAKYNRARRADLKRRQHNPERLKQWRDKLRSDLFAAYGNACACCGETEPKFLTIDHVHNDGNKERPPIGSKRTRGGGIHMYARLRKEGFPQSGRYQLLCWNCNCGRAQNGGICPHAARGVVRSMHSKSTYSEPL